MESNLTKKEPLPTKNNYPAVWDLVIKDIQDRDRFGEAKYKTRLQPFNGRNALKDAFQESLDLTVYIRQAIEEWPNPNLNEGWTGWLAGIIDGEGSLTIGISQTGRYYSPHMQVVNADIKMLEKLIEVTGEGKIYPRKIYKKQLRTYVWDVAIQPAAVILDKIYPWLITKKEQAKAFIELAKLRENRNTYSEEKREGVTEEEWKLVEQIQKLKLGGRKGTNKRHISLKKEWKESAKKDKS